MSGHSANSDRTMTARPRETASRTGVGFSIAVTVLLVAVVDKLLGVMQAPSAARIVLLVAYTIGLAAACFSLWQFRANRPGKILGTDGDTLDRKNDPMQPSGEVGRPEVEGQPSPPADR